LARLEINTHQGPAAAINAVERFALDDGRAVGAVHGVIDLTPPHHRGVWLVLAELEQRAYVADAAGEQVIARLTRRHDRHAVVRLQRLLPIDFAVLRVEAVKLVRRPNQQLLAAGRLDHRRRGIAGLLGRKSLPDFAAAVL